MYRPTFAREAGSFIILVIRTKPTMTATKKDDVLLPQDAQAVDPSQLSALTPEVVSCSGR